MKNTRSWRPRSSQSAALQEHGAVRDFGGNYDSTYGRILEINSDYDESVAFAFSFWDGWVDASDHEWRYYDPIRESDWPRLAREVALAVRSGELPANERFLDRLRPKPRRSLMDWFKSLFG